MGFFSLLWIVIVGFIVGVLARWFYPGPVPMEWWLTILLGIAGSFVGGLISSLLFRGGRSFHMGGLIMSVIGALIVLWAYMKFMVK